MIYRSTLFCRLQVYWDARYVDGGTIVTIHGYLISWSDKWCRLPRLLHVPDCAYLVLCVSPFGHAFRFALPFPWICMRGILLVFDLHIIWPFVAVVVCCLISSRTEHSCSSGFVPYRSRALFFAMEFLSFAPTFPSSSRSLLREEAGMTSTLRESLTNWPRTRGTRQSSGRGRRTIAPASLVSLGSCHTASTRNWAQPPLEAFWSKQASSTRSKSNAGVHDALSLLVSGLRWT